MKKYSIISIFLVYVFCGVAVFSQPIIPKEKISFSVDPEVRRQLENLYSESPQVRAQAVTELGDMKERAFAAVPYLIEMLSDSGVIQPYGMVSSKAADALVKIGPVAVEPLIAILKSSRERTVRSGAVSALGRLRDARAVEPLIEAFRGADDLFRLYVAEALGQIGRPAVEPLSVLLRDRNETMRQAATGALGQIAMFKRDAVAAELLLVSLIDADIPVRRQAAAGLYNISGWYRQPAAIAAAVIALDDPDAEVASYAALTLGSVGGPHVVAALIRSLARKEDEEAGRGSAGYDVHASAVSALVKIGKPAAELLRDALRDRNGSIREGAAVALGQIKDAHSIEPLIGLLADSDVRVRLAGRDALIAIGAVTTWPLIVALKSAEGPAQGLIADILSKVTGENFGSDQVKWYDWYQRRNK